MNAPRICLYFFLGLSVPSAFPQGSLTPSGVPAPTMKTLDQVEPRKPINATNTPGDSNSAFKITASGSYYLTGPVTGISGKHGILITASDVTVDLRGFAITGVAGSLDGLHVASGNSRPMIRNGTVSNWGEDGVDEVDADPTDGIYENIRATGNGGDGLRLSGKCVIDACKLEHNTGYGVSTTGQATIKNCTANDNGLSGFYFGKGSILDSVAFSNGSSGVENFDEPVLIKNCVAFENGDAGLRSGSGGKFIDCISRSNNSLGIYAGAYATVTNCTVKNNPTGIYADGSCRIVGNLAEGNSTGITTNSDKNVFDGNVVTQLSTSGIGIEVTNGAVRNLIIRNTVGNYTPNYSIAPNNRYGPIVDITATGAAAVSGSSAADTTTTTHPLANFSY